MLDAVGPTVEPLTHGCVADAANARKGRPNLARLYAVCDQEIGDAGGDIHKTNRTSRLLKHGCFVGVSMLIF